MNANVEAPTYPQIADIFERYPNAHFVQLGGGPDGKVPSGYKGKCANGCKAGYKGNHAPECQGWMTQPLTQEGVHRLWGAYQSDVSNVGKVDARPLLGIIPASVDIYAVDVDAKAKRTIIDPQSGEARDEWQSVPCDTPTRNAARVTWDWLLALENPSTDFVATVGEARSKRGGLHLLYRVEPHYNTSNQQGNWVCAEQSPKQNRTVESHCQGEIRYARGYVAICDLDEWHKAVTAPGDPTPIPKKLDILKHQIRRVARAAGLCQQNEGNRHEYALNGTIANAGDNAFDNPDVWFYAAEMHGWDAATTGEMQSLWDGAVREKGQPDSTLWKGNPKPKQPSRMEQQCVLDHELNPRERADIVIDMIGDNVRGFDGSFWRLTPNRPIWKDLNQSQNKRGSFLNGINGVLGELDVCQQCARNMADMLMNRFEDKGCVEQAPIRPAFMQNGVVCIVEPFKDTQIRTGLAEVSPMHRLRPATPDDLVNQEPTFDLGTAPLDLLNKQSDIERVLMQGSLGMDEADVRWFMAWASYTLESPLKVGPLLLAEPGYGKSTLCSTFARAFAVGKVSPFKAENIEHLATKRFMKSIFTICDDMHAAKPDHWARLHTLVGGAENIARGMHEIGDPGQSRAGVILNAERRKMKWNPRVFEGGMHEERLEYFVQMEPAECTKLSTSAKNHLLEEAQLKHFWWRIIASAPAQLSRTPNMRKARLLVEEAMSRAENAEGESFDFTPDGRVVTDAPLEGDGATPPSKKSNRKKEEDISNWNFDGKTITKEHASGEVEVEELPSEPDHDQPALRSADAVVEPVSESVSDAVPPWLNFSAAPDPEPAPAPTPEPAKATCRCGTPGCDGWGGDACLASEDEWSAATA